MLFKINLGIKENKITKIIKFELNIFIMYIFRYLSMYNNLNT